MYGKKSKDMHANLSLRVLRYMVSCANISSIHGFNHIVRKKVTPYERLLWFLLVASATAWCIELGLQAWDHYQTRPVVISLEKDHWKWNFTFPSATLCLNAIDYDKAEELIAELNISDENAEKFKSFLASLALVDLNNYQDFDKYMNNSWYLDVDKYEEWVLRSSVALDDPVDIEQSFGELDEFITVLTEFGVCYTYNSKISIYNTPEYQVKQTNQLVEGNTTLIMINPSIPAPSISIRSLRTGYKIFFHAPDEMPEMNTKAFVVSEATFTNIELYIESVWTPAEVQALRISQRNCRFFDESNLKHSPVYSYNSCRMECRRSLCQKLCDCVPYYYKRSNTESICNPLGMQCLYRNRRLLISLNDSVCTCVENCDINSVTISKYEVTDWILGTNLQWRIVQYPTVRYKRSLIFSQTNLLVQIGGTAGLFLGCSILSLIELIYFLTLRFYWGFIRSRHT